jgi:hypothetical protein
MNMATIVKDKKEFECLMRAREERMHEEFDGVHCISIPYHVDKDGEPLGPEDKRVICEAQKLVLGTDTAYTLCSETSVYTEHRWSQYSRNFFKELGFKPGDHIRFAHVFLHASDKENISFFQRFIVPLAFHGHTIDLRKDTPSKRFDGPSGTACAYPGGCD